MLASNSRMTTDLLKEECKNKNEKQDKELAKKIQSFHMGRGTYLFPGITWDVNEHEFNELMLDLDQVYETAHRLYCVIVKYTRSIERMSKINSILGPQAVKIYPAQHQNHATAQSIFQTHQESSQFYKDFSQNHKQTCEQFKQFYSQFDTIFAKLKQRDKTLEEFSHYFNKLRELRENHKHNTTNMGGQIDPAKLAKDEETIQRNVKKYEETWALFQQQNNWLYTQVTDLIRNKYKTMTPIVIRFISVAQAFFSKAGSTFAKLQGLSNRSANQSIVQPQSYNPPQQEYSYEEGRGPATQYGEGYYQQPTDENGGFNFKEIELGEPTPQHQPDQYPQEYQQEAGIADQQYQYAQQDPNTYYDGSYQYQQDQQYQHSYDQPQYQYEQTYQYQDGQEYKQSDGQYQNY